jgi:hypothetical protein
MTFTQQLNFKEYAKLNFRLAYKKTTFILLHVMSIFIILSPLLNKNDDSPTFNIVFGILLNLLIPIAVYRSSRSLFKTHEILHGKMEWTFEGHSLKVRSNNLNSEADLRPAVNIVEYNAWFVINYTKKSSFVIYKNDLSTAQIQELRNFFIQLKTVPLKLIPQDH